jgi:hypothetical protein
VGSAVPTGLPGQKCFTWLSCGSRGRELSRSFEPRVMRACGPSADIPRHPLEPNVLRSCQSAASIAPSPSGTSTRTWCRSRCASGHCAALPGRCEAEAEQGEPLGDVVVQLASEPPAASSWLRMSRPLSSRSSSSARFNAVMSVWVMTARTPRRRDRARRPRQRGRELQRQRQHQCRAEQASTSSSHHFSCNPTVTGSNASLAQMPIRAPDVDGGRRIEVAMAPHPVRYPL